MERSDPRAGHVHGAQRPGHRRQPHRRHHDHQHRRASDDGTHGTEQDPCDNTGSGSPGSNGTSGSPRHAIPTSSPSSPPSSTARPGRRVRRRQELVRPAGRGRWTEASRALRRARKQGRSPAPSTVDAPCCPAGSPRSVHPHRDPRPPWASGGEPGSRPGKAACTRPGRRRQSSSPSRSTRAAGASGRHDGSSQARALTTTTTSGGKRRGSASPWAFLQAVQSLFEEPLAPLRDDLPPGVEAGGEFDPVLCAQRHVVRTLPGHDSPPQGEPYV